MCRRLIVLVAGLLLGCGASDPPEEPIQGILTVQAMAFAPDGKHLLVGYALNDIPLPSPYSTVRAKGNKYLALWDLETGNEVRAFRGHSRNVQYVAVAPDGKRAVSMSQDQTVRVWNKATGKQEHVFEDIMSATAALSSDGRLVVAAGRKNRLNLWDIASGALERVSDPFPDSRIWGLAFAPDGKTIVSAGDPALEDKENVRLWDADSGKLRSTVKKAEGSLIWSAKFSPDGRHFVTERRSGPPERKVDLVLWDTATGGEIRAFQRYTRSLADVHFSPDGKHLVCAAGNMINVWEVATGKEVWWEPFPAEHLAVAPDGKTIVTSTSHIGHPSRDYQSGVRFDTWDLPTGKHQRTIKLPHPYSLN